MFSLKYIKKVYSLCIFLSVFSIIFASDIYSDSWAVIIGINDYNNIKGLHYAVEDAQDMKNILVEKFNFEDKNIMLLTDEDATRDNIISALYETAQKAGDKSKAGKLYKELADDATAPSGIRTRAAEMSAILGG